MKENSTDSTDRSQETIEYDWITARLRDGKHSAGSRMVEEQYSESYWEGWHNACAPLLEHAEDTHGNSR